MSNSSSTNALSDKTLANLVSLGAQVILRSMGNASATTVGDTPVDGALVRNIIANRLQAKLAVFTGEK